MRQPELSEAYASFPWNSGGQHERYGEEGTGKEPILMNGLFGWEGDDIGDNDPLDLFSEGGHLIAEKRNDLAGNLIPVKRNAGLLRGHVVSVERHHNRVYQPF